MNEKKKESASQPTPSGIVALVVPLVHTGIVQSILNTAKFLAIKGYAVDLFTFFDPRFPLPRFADQKIAVHVIRCPITATLISSQRFFYRYTRYIEIFLLTFEFAVHAWFRPHAYVFMIGFEPEGSIMAGILSRLWGVPYVYHSLEIYESNPTAPRFQRFLKYLENWFTQRAIFCLIQDENRAAIFAQENHVQRNNVLIAYHSPLGQQVFPEKSSYLRDRFQISPDKILVLIVGSLMIDHCVDQIVRSVDSWPEKFVLVLHGWFGTPEDQAVISPEIDRRKQRVFLSTEVLEEEHKYVIFQSADIGLVFYNPTDKNLKFAAGSSGKLFDFMRTGVPVIANDLPGMRNLVEQSGCGKVVETAEQIGQALPHILAHYTYYREQLLQTYPKYEFGACYTPVLEQIIAKIGEFSGHNTRLCYEKISLHKIMGIFRTFLRKSKIAIARMRMTMGVAPLSYLWAHDRGFPIHRYYVEMFLKAWAADICGHCLEFQEDSYTSRFGGKAVQKLDILHQDTQNPRATLVADLTKPNTLPSATFDCIICTHVLHVIFELEKALTEMYRILKPEGVLLVAVPQVSMCDPDWHELWRFTPEGLQRLLENVFGEGNVLVYGYGNSLLAAGEIRGLSAYEFSRKEITANDPRFAVEVCARATKHI